MAHRPAATCLAQASHLPIADIGLFAAAFRQHIVERAPHAGRYLDDRAEPEHQLGVGAVAEPGPDRLAQRAELKRLGVQRDRDPAGAGGEQDPLQRLPGIDPVLGTVSGCGAQRGDPRGPGACSMN